MKRFLKYFLIVSFFFLVFFTGKKVIADAVCGDRLPGTCIPAITANAICRLAGYEYCQWVTFIPPTVHCCKDVIPTPTPTPLCTTGTLNDQQCLFQCIEQGGGQCRMCSNGLSICLAATPGPPTAAPTCIPVYSGATCTLTSQCCSGNCCNSRCTMETTCASPTTPPGAATSTPVPTTPAGEECLTPNYWCADRGQNCPATCPEKTNVRLGACSNGGKCCSQCSGGSCTNPGYPTFNVCDGGATSTKVSWTASSCSTYYVCWCPKSVIDGGKWKDECCNSGWFPAGHKVEGLSSQNYTITGLTSNQGYVVFVGAYSGATGNPDARFAGFTQTCPPTNTPAPPTATRPPGATATSAPTPTVDPRTRGDATGDGAINEADYLIWKTNYGNRTTAPVYGPADFNKDTTTNLIDFEIWRHNQI